MEEFHKEDLERVRIQFLDYLSYLLNNTPMSQNDENSMTREKVHYLIDICLESQKNGIEIINRIYDKEKLGELFINQIKEIQQILCSNELPGISELNNAIKRKDKRYICVSCEQLDYIPRDIEYLIKNNK